MKRTTSYTFNTCKKCLFYLLFILSGYYSFRVPLLRRKAIYCCFLNALYLKTVKKPERSVNLTNIGKDTATYKISFTQIRMDENGKFVEYCSA